MTTGIADEPSQGAATGLELAELAEQDRAAVTDVAAAGTFVALVAQVITVPRDRAGSFGGWPGSMTRCSVSMPRA